MRRYFLLIFFSFPLFSPFSFLSLLSSDLFYYPFTLLSIYLPPSFFLPFFPLLILSSRFVNLILHKAFWALSFHSIDRVKFSFFAFFCLLLSLSLSSIRPFFFLFLFFLLSFNDHFCYEFCNESRNLVKILPLLLFLFFFF